MLDSWWRIALPFCPNDVLDALWKALEASRDWARGREVSNATRSARFCSDVFGKLDPLLYGAALTRRYISVDDHGKKSPGEWLLDGTWTEDVRPDDRMPRGVPARIRCAIECESNTSGLDYFTDFSKLLSISADIKLFLAGLNQRTKTGACNYIDLRVQQSSAMVDRYDQTSPDDWYLAFWPSPLAVDGQSLWELIDDGEIAHLHNVVLYRFADRTFQKVGDARSACRRVAAKETAATR